MAEAAAGASPPAGRLAWAAAATLPLAAIAALTAPLWLGQAIPVWDGVDFYLPVFGHLADALREGRLPLWDPYSNGGEPFLADPQRGILNPLHLLLGLAVDDVVLGFVLGWLVHWGFGALGLLWQARRLGAGPAGAALAAAAYTLSGFWISHAEHLPYLYVAAWLPWVLGLADEAVARRRAAPALLSAGALGLCAVGGGYPMLVAFTGVAAALWLSLRHLPAAPPGPERRRALRWVAGTLALMAVVLVAAWSPLLVAFLREATAVSGRLEAISTEQSVYGAPVNLRTASSLFFPAAVNHLAFREVDLGGDISMANAALAFAVPPLAATWAWCARRERRAWLVAFAAVMLLTSMGGVGGVRWLLHWLLPPLRHMRFNAPFRLYWLLAACLAAGAGLALLARDAAARRAFRWAALGWLAIGAAAAGGLAAWAAAAGRPFGPALPGVLLPALVTGPLVVALAFALERRPAPALVGALALVVALDAAAAAHACRATVLQPAGGGLEQLAAARAAVRTSDGEPPPRLPSASTGAFNVHLLTRTPVLWSYTSFRDEEVNGVLHASRFAEVLCGPHRFWLSPFTEPDTPRAAALAALAEAGGDGPVPVFVAAGAARRPGPRLAPGAFGLVRVRSYLPERIVLDAVVPGDAPALLASTERLTPGWSVTVDGRPAPVIRTNLHFRGVEVGPGVHRVEWRYAPAFWWPLVALSAVTLLACAAGAAWLAIRGSRRPSDPPPPSAAGGG